MAERIVSPGVFTREKDLSFLPQGISEIGAAIIGPTKKGPSFVPTIVRNFVEFEEIFGSYDTSYYTPYAVKNYLDSAGTVTIVKVGYLGGYKVAGVNILVAAAVGGVHTRRVIATLLPTRQSNEGNNGLSGTVSGGATIAAATVNIIAGGQTETIVGLQSTEKAGGLGGFEVDSPATYLTKAFTSTVGGTSNAYLYKTFRTQLSESIYVVQDTGSLINPGSVQTTASIFIEVVSQSFNTGTETVDTSGGNFILTNTGNKDAAAARTPFIQSQKVGTNTTNLFKIYMRADGENSNSYYILVKDIKKPQNSNSSTEYAQFGIALYAVGGTTSIESYNGLNLDPQSSNYLPKVVGDQFQVVASDGEVVTYGNYPNLSRLIRVGDYKEDVFTSNKNLQPMGFAAINNPIVASSAAFVFSASINTKQAYNSNPLTYQENLGYGFKIDQGHEEHETAGNISYLSPIPFPVATGNNAAFNLVGQNGFGKVGSQQQTDFTNFVDKASLLTIDSSVVQLKFAVPFQFGFDGKNPARDLKTGTDISSTNTMGHDCSTSTASGSVAYKRAINAISNPDEYDINMLVTPGVVHKHHSVVTNHAIDKVERRADAFYVMDGNDIDDNVATAVNNIKNLDSNYVATYYPWVKMDNPAGNGQIFVPPSVVIAGVIAFTDSVAHEWFAPAGLTRGGLSNVRMTKKKLTHTDRDTLYEGRVNPIASFPNQGVVVFGQKTLQAKPSALDRINVRRLLIRLKKFIASSSRFLVFEQNDSSTRSRFLNIVNPFLESVQSNSGLSAFKVVMDESNNTPDVIDRNQMIGQIFIQPTRTAEFIVLDFSVLPTGAAFPE